MKGFPLQDTGPGMNQMFHDLQEDAEYRKAWAGDYDGTECPNCNRLRMMKCSNEKRRCEKCNWDPEAKAYSEYDANR